MGRRDPPSAGTTTVEVKVHPRREDDAAVHPGRAGHPAVSSHPPPGRRTSTPLPPPASTGSTTERSANGDFWLFKRWLPWLIPSFVVANIVLFLISMYVNNCPKNSLGGSCIAKFLGRFSFQPLKENPLFGPSSSTLDKMGALQVDKVVHGHQVWRLVSCIWLHGGVIHVLANMLSLIFIGIRLEHEFGFVRIGFLYVISGFGGSLLSALFIQSGISVGASGALFGLLGGMLSELLINWTIYANKLAALLTLIVIVVINLAVGILPHVDNFAHIGGFISGFLLGFILLIRPQFKWISEKKSRPGRGSPPLKYKHKPYQYALWVISFILLTSGFIVGMIFLLRGANLNDSCSWCHYLTCVPTSKWSCKAKEIYCESTEIGNQLNITCLSNGRSGQIPLTSSSQAQQLCTRLCS